MALEMSRFKRRSSAEIRRSTESAGQFIAADYAALLSSLAFLFRPGGVERLLKLAEEQGIPVPDDLA
jgi:hypothetical protein